MFKIVTQNMWVIITYINAVNVLSSWFLNIFSYLCIGKLFLNILLYKIMYLFNFEALKQKKSEFIPLLILKGKLYYLILDSDLIREL